MNVIENWPSVVEDGFLAASGTRPTVSYEWNSISKVYRVVAIAKNHEGKAFMVDDILQPHGTSDDPQQMLLDMGHRMGKRFAVESILPRKP